MTKLAIDQLKPRRSSLSATSVCAVQASAPQYIAIHCPSALSTQSSTAFSVYVITLHCVGASERIALFTLLYMQYITSHIALCTLHIGHWTLHFALRWRVRAQADLASPIEDGSNEPLSVGATTPSQPVHYMATSTL